MSDKRMTLEDWVEKLKSEDMPVFGKTAQEVAKISSGPAVPTSVLANIILRDASMTARVLRLANSAFYTKSTPITTVSRAITTLGFDVVAKACISVAFVDSMLSGKPREFLVRDMARSFYAAVLARTMALSRKDESPEEVFVAALLYRLGEMAFWCFGGRIAEKLELLLEEPHVIRGRAEHMLLGFRLSNLTEALAREWMLGDVILAALATEHSEDSRSLGVVLAHQYAEIFDEPDSGEEQKRLLGRMARYASLDPELFREIIKENSNLAAELALSFGAEVTIPVIPGQVGASPPRLPIPPSPPSSARITALNDLLVPDANLQLKILRELVMVAETQPELDAVLQLAMEGMYRGIGLDRVVFLAKNREGTKLVPRFASEHRLREGDEEIHCGAAAGETKYILRRVSRTPFRLGARLARSREKNAHGRYSRYHGAWTIPPLASSSRNRCDRHFLRGPFENRTRSR